MRLSLMLESRIWHAFGSESCKSQNTSKSKEPADAKVTVQASAKGIRYLKSFTYL